MGVVPVEFLLFIFPSPLILKALSLSFQEKRMKKEPMRKGMAAIMKANPIPKLADRYPVKAGPNPPPIPPMV